MRKTRTLLLGILCVGLMSLAMADEALLQRPEVQAFIKQHAREDGYTPEALGAVLQQATLKPMILTILDRPSTAQPWYLFRPNHVNSKLAIDGVRFWQQNSAALARAEALYGVEPQVVVAILGIETHYGRNMGSFRVLDALTTIAFGYPRRAEYFQQELSQFLMLAREEGGDPLRFKGSYAGAMGMAQFMPSSFRTWAVDFNGDRQRDIWNSPDDVIGSVAHYLQAHGWQHHADSVYPAVVSPAVAEQLAADKFNLHYTLNTLRTMGVVVQAELPADVLAVVFPLEFQPGVTEYWLGLQNFYTLTRYNKSTLYAMAVTQLANDIKSRYFSQLATQQ